MAQQLNTLLNFRYEVRCPEGCTVSDSAGNLIITVAPGTPAYFMADGRPVTLSADSALMLPANSEDAATSSSGSVLSTTGELVRNLELPMLGITHATWFDNKGQSALTVVPASWRNEVMTCYLKTSVPVTLSGVTWLYGEPSMVDGYTCVIALQQIDAVTVLANLAYVVPQ